MNFFYKLYSDKLKKNQHDKLKNKCLKAFAYSEIYIKFLSFQGVEEIHVFKGIMIR